MPHHHHHHKTAADYTLRVSAGSSPQTLKVINPNDELNPILIDNEHFTGYLLVRVANFSGKTPSPSQPPIPNPPSEYFKGRNRRYSISIQGRWKKQWGGNDIIFGMDFDTKIRTPTGASVAIKIAKWLDPALEADLFCEKPSLFTPLVSGMNALAVYPPNDPEVRNGGGPPASVSTNVKANKVTPSPSKSQPTPANPSIPPPSVDIGTWSFHSRHIPENTNLLFPSTVTPPPNLGSYDKRKKFFALPAQRSLAYLSPDYIYAMDFYDAYFDFGTCSLKLPGFSVNAFRYWDGQPLKFQAKARDGSAFFFVVMFEMIEKDHAEEPAEDESDEEDESESESGEEDAEPVIEPEVVGHLQELALDTNL